MFNKLTTLCACLALIAAGALYSVPAQAVTGWYFTTMCTVPNPMQCPGGPLPYTYGPYATLGDCSDAVYAASQSYTGRYPRTVSNCYQQ